MQLVRLPWGAVQDLIPYVDLSMGKGPKIVRTLHGRANNLKGDGSL